MLYPLYIISTPIGNLNDISLRALDVLQNVDYVLCEDTRVSQKLLNKFKIKVKLIVYNDHNAKKVIPQVIEHIRSSNDCKTFALISDAGTPLISDPGYNLVNACIENGIKYTFIPGASAVISALVLSGFPSDRFMFLGFVNPPKLEEVRNIDSTLIFFESPNRLIDTLKIMAKIFANRKVAIVREITKIHEEVVRGEFESVIEHFEQNKPRGEFVIVLSPPEIDNFEKIGEIMPLIECLIDRVSKKDLSKILSKFSGISRNVIYNFLIEYSGKEE